jgi:hypothetical protein
VKGPASAGLFYARILPDWYQKPEPCRCFLQFVYQTGLNFAITKPGEVHVIDLMKK